MHKGKIFNIQRFSTSDGPGIRTVVFFKGCPLDCAWCHNPESKSRKTELFYNVEKCIGCGSCVDVCSQKAHFLAEGYHSFLRKNCINCGRCAEVCFAEALKLCGEEKSAEEIVEAALADAPFYGDVGGITLSGGEPLLQYDFALEILKLAKEKGLNTAIETCGYTNKNLAEINGLTDLWLYDIKLLSEDEHKKYTGADNKTILKNLKALDKLGANTVLRCPIIPRVNFNEAHFESLAVLADSLTHVSAVHLEPYHPLGICKAEKLGRVQKYKNEEFLNPDELQEFSRLLAERVKCEVRII